MIIKVLGPGCSKCVEAYEIVSKAVAASGSDATVEKITDLREIMALGAIHSEPSLLRSRHDGRRSAPAVMLSVGWR